jgi:CHAT domain-containing protein
LLRTYTEDFSEEVDAEDQNVMERLRSSSSRWQATVAQQMLRSARGSAEIAGWRSEVRWVWKWWLAGGLATACVAVAVVAWWSRETPEKVQGMLAQACSEQRMIQLRYPGASYAPSRVTRGPEEGRLAKPAVLFKAEEIVARRQSSDPRNADWLRVAAETEILEGQPEVAILALNRVRESQPDSKRLKLDLALAYFEQASKTDKPDLRRVIDLLTGILKDSNQENDIRLAAIFNLAITYERTQAWDMASATWEDYLRHDSTSAWARDAKQHLENIKGQLQSRGLRTPDKSLSPSSLLLFASSSSSPPDPQLSEHYQEVALRSWLAPALKDPHSEYVQALQALAGLLQRRHGDSWLADFLRMNPRRNLPATEELQRAISSNARNHHEEALRHLAVAKRLFTVQNNFPGMVRAEFEETYALQRLLKGTQCLERSKLLLQRLSSARYPWLRTQLLLEKATCENLVGDFASVEVDLNTSLRQAKDSHYPTLTLRVLAIAASVNRQEGKYVDAWQYAVEGLDRYWKGRDAPERLYNLYTSMELCAQETGFLNAAEALGRQSITVIENGDKRVLLGAAHLLLADLLMGQGEAAAAETEVRRADEILLAVPDESYVNTYKLMSKIQLANLALRRGETESAFAALKPARSLLGSVEDRLVRLDFHTIDGTIQRRLGHLPEAEAAYQDTIAVAEKSLASLHDEPSRLKWIKAADEAYRGLVRILLERGQDNSAMEHWEWYKSRSLAYAYDRDIPSLHAYSHTGKLSVFAAQSLRPLKQTRVIYVVFDEGVQIWVVGEKLMRSAWVAVSQDQLQRMTEDFSNACATPNSSLADLKEQGRRLFALLVQPIMAELPASLPLTVEVDGPLSKLPMEALQSPEGWYLGERYILVYSPGILQEERLRRPGPISPDDHLLLIDSGAVPGHELERRTIRDLFHRVAVIDPETQAWSVVLSRLGNADMFHFVGHGAIARESRAPAVQSGKYLLQAGDFPSQSLKKLHMAVLAACSTGTTDENGLLDTNSLVHSFLAGGVPQVIASRWNVDSESTANLMSSFYTRMGRNESPPEAMRSARRDLMRSNSHPYFWASFNVVGRL